MTRRRGDAEMYALTRGAAFDLVVCHGGDGTLSETVNGLMGIDAAQRPPVSYLPGGSTNDFAASLRISSEPAVAAQSATLLAQVHLLLNLVGGSELVLLCGNGHDSGEAGKDHQHRHDKRKNSLCVHVKFSFFGLICIRKVCVTYIVYQFFENVNKYFMNSRFPARFRRID
jgi:hypothetical protein